MNTQHTTMTITDIYTPAINAAEVKRLENINSKIITIDIDKKHKLLAVKITLEDDSIVIKKVMK